MDQLIQRRIGQIHKAVGDSIFEILTFEEDNEELCELYIENDFSEECYEIWDQVATSCAVPSKIRQLMHQEAISFCIAVLSLFRSAPNWYKILPAFITELLKNIFEKDEFYEAFETLYDPV